MAKSMDTDALPKRKKTTILSLAKMRENNEKIIMLTSYDASFASLVDDCGVDIILVGDSLGMVIQGHSSTLPVTLDEMTYHTACVARGARFSMVLSDLPFASYSTPDQAMTHAAQLMRAGAEMVKLEGGQWLTETVQHLVQRGIPVCAHLGLTPQAVHQLSGFRVQGKTADSAERLINDALALEKAGASLLVLEAIPADLGTKVTQAVKIPTIGIGAGVDCSGQVLVLHDMLGIFQGHRPKFVKDFMQGQADIRSAIVAYVEAVKSGQFPSAEHCF
jgi:3-methyl-2-oxobutanoate hydroxymethyltransferase